MIAPTSVPTLRDYGRMLRDGWVLILAATLLSLGAAWLATSLVAPTYSASSRVFLSAPGPSSPRAAMEGNRSSLVRVESYVGILASEQVLRRVILDVGLDISPAELKPDLLVIPTPGSALIVITATYGDAEQARDIANSAALNLIQLTKEIDLGRDGPVSDVTLIDAATLPNSSVLPVLSSNLVLGGGIGFAVAAVLVLAFGIRRDSIVSRAQVEDIVRESRGSFDNSGGVVR
nr:Wzz/FepE/Etk N-terminal domain-containing protein [Rhodococcus sp. (in: high G+C Gram-positive bacteria)]